jgi:hypothetical protein
VRPPEEWREETTLEDAIAHPAPGTGHDPARAMTGASPVVRGMLWMAASRLSSSSC